MGRSATRIVGAVSCVAAVGGGLALMRSAYVGPALTFLNSWESLWTQTSFSFWFGVFLCIAGAAGLVALFIDHRRTATSASGSSTQCDWTKSSDVFWVGVDLMDSILALESEGSKDAVLPGLEHGLIHAQSLGHQGDHVEQALRQLVQDVDGTTLSAERRRTLVTRIRTVMKQLGDEALEAQNERTPRSRRAS